MPPKRKSSSTAQQPPPKRTRAGLSTYRQGTQDKRSNSRQTRQSVRITNRRNDAPATVPQAVSPGLQPVSNVASISTSPALQGPPSVPVNSAPTGGGHDAPNELLGQLSSIVQQLTSAIQGNTPLPYNPVPIGDTNLEADDPSDALSEVSIQQQQNYTAASAMPPTSVTTSTVGQMLQPGTVSLPPVTPRIREKIISGEFIDFATLLPNAMFSGSTGTETSKSLTVQLTPVGNDLSVRPQPSAKKINSFASWMEAWNIYLAILINHSPARAPQLVAYQRIITSASTQYPLAAWLNYDIQFRTLAASDTSLRWDTRHTDLWLQCVTAPSLSTIRWPCSHCGATNHYPRNCPFRPHAIPAPTDSHRQANAPSSSGGQHTATGGLPNFRHSTCHAYNRSVCRRQACQFLHQCELCGADHSAKNCPNRGSTTQ